MKVDDAALKNVGDGQEKRESRKSVQRGADAAKGSRILAVVDLLCRPGETHCYKGDCDQDYPPGG